MTPLRWHYLSSRKMTFAVATDARGMLVDLPPIARKFQGQPLDNLCRWMQRQGGFRRHDPMHASVTHPVRDQPS